MTKTIWIINQYASTPETGMGGRHYHLARQLEALGFQVYLILASYTHLLRQGPSFDGAACSERREGVNVVWIKVPEYAHAHSKMRIFNWFSFALRLRRAGNVVSDKPDVVWYSSPSLVGFLGAERLAERFNARLVFEVRDIWPLTLCDVGGYSPHNPFVRFLQWVENRAYRRADVVISNLKNAHEHMVEHGLRRDRFHWIPNGVALDEVTHPQPLDGAVVDMLPDGGFAVGYAGTLGVANCLDVLIEAAALLRDKPDIKFVLVGEGKERPRLQGLVAERGLENIVFTGAIPKVQIQSMLQRFDVSYIGLTRSRLFEHGVSPNKLFDYMYAARPIIYAIESGAYHPVTDAGAGVECPAENPQALADAIVELHELPAEQRAAMGRNARDAVLQQYEYGALARQLATVLLPSASD